MPNESFHVPQESFGFFVGLGRMSVETTDSKSKREPEKGERKSPESGRDTSLGSRPCSRWNVSQCVVK